MEDRECYSSEKCQRVTDSVKFSACSSWPKAICGLTRKTQPPDDMRRGSTSPPYLRRSEEHTSELQSRLHLVCRLLLEKKKKYLTSTAISRAEKQTLHVAPSWKRGLACLSSPGLPSPARPTALVLRCPPPSARRP